MKQKYIYKKTFIVLSVLLLTFGFAGCLKDEITLSDTTGNDVIITINIPGISSSLPGVRSISGAGGEAVVETIDVLVFKSNGVNPEILLEHKQGTNISQSTNSGDKYKVQFRARLTAAPSATNVIIIANASAETTAAVYAAGGVGAEKDDILTALRHASVNGGGTANGWKWNANATNNTTPIAGTDYTPIPMYGEKAVAGITNGMKVENIDLIRMLARIDVVNNATSDITLSEVYVVNYNTAGYIAPAWNTNGSLQAALPPNPMIPSNANPQIDPGDISKSMAYTYTGSGINGLIYTYESVKTSGIEGNNSHKNATCLIVKGTLTSNSKVYYYRIDFTAATDGSGKSPGVAGFDPSTVSYMPVYRNHLYTFTISRVDGIGYDSFGEALSSLGVKNNLKTELLVIDESGIKNMVFNGQHYLGSDNLIISSTGGAATILVLTNYTSGWDIDNEVYPNGVEYISGSGWISSVARGSSNPLKDNIELTVSVNGSATREAWIHVKAGRLRHKVKVTQEQP